MSSPSRLFPPLSLSSLYRVLHIRFLSSLFFEDPSSRINHDSAWFYPADPKYSIRDNIVAGYLSNASPFALRLVPPLLAEVSLSFCINPRPPEDEPTRGQIRSSLENRFPPASSSGESTSFPPRPTFSPLSPLLVLTCLISPVPPRPKIGLHARLWRMELQPQVHVLPRSFPAPAFFGRRAIVIPMESCAC